MKDTQNPQGKFVCVMMVSPWTMNIANGLPKAGNEQSTILECAMSDSKFESLPNLDGTIDEIHQSFENELQSIQAEQSEIFFEFSELNSDYATLDIEKILKECSAEAVDLISYQLEMMRLHERMLENNSRIIGLLQDRFIHYANISDLRKMIQKGLSHLEATKAAYTAKKEQKSQTARAGGLARVANDPRQKDKEFVLTCWNVWQRHPERYQGKADFARDMLSKCDHLSSQKTIEDWCREWEKTSPSQLSEHSAR